MGSEVKVYVLVEHPDGRRETLTVMSKATGLWASHATALLRERGEMSEDDIPVRVWRDEEESIPA
jgi:hypothetical protein